MLAAVKVAPFLIGLRLAAQVFPTGDPVIAAGGHAMPPMTPAEYRKFADSVEGQHSIRFKLIHRLPPGLSPNYRLGLNFVFASANHGWILDRDSEGYKLYLDLTGDGDLSHSQPFRFSNMNGIPAIDVPMHDEGRHWTARFELVVDPHDPTDGPSIRVILLSERSGNVLLTGHKIPFRLTGASGRYGIVGAGVAFDREDNGHYESYQASDRWVNLAGKTYAFTIDPQGASLTLKPSDPLPDRPSLEINSQLPAVFLADLEGNRHVFVRNPAAYTLLEFWSTNCIPCREEMPKLIALYDQVPHSRLQIIGISSDQSEEVLKRYLAEFAIGWPECRESYDGDVHRLLRIQAEPTYFLLSASGKILDHWAGSGSTIARIEAALK